MYGLQTTELDSSNSQEDWYKATLIIIKKYNAHIHKKYKKGQKTSKKNMGTRQLQIHEYNKLNTLQNLTKIGTW